MTERPTEQQLANTQGEAADGTAISKYIGRGSRRNSNKLDRTTEQPTIRPNQCSRSAFNCESGASLLNSSTTVHGVPSGFEYLSGNYRPTVGCIALYIANCCSVGRSRRSVQFQGSRPNQPKTRAELLTLLLTLSILLIALFAIGIESITAAFSIKASVQQQHKMFLFT